MAESALTCLAKDPFPPFARCLPNSNMQKRTFELDWAGKKLYADFTDLAEQANGSVLIRYGETAVLVTAVMGDRAGASNYFPLSVEFEEKFYAAGAILGSRFIRREGRPSDGAILAARIVDRTIRPLFDQSLRHEVQVVITVLSVGDDDPDVLGVVGASLALAVSDIPWNGPIGVTRIARRKSDKSLVINPSYKDREEGALDFEILACGKDGRVNMIETAADEAAEEDIGRLLEVSMTSADKLVAWQREIVREIGRDKRKVETRNNDQSLHSFFVEHFKEKLRQTLFSGRAGKDHLQELKRTFKEESGRALENPGDAEDFFELMIDEELHRGIIEENKRPDGRGRDDLRPLYAQAGGISPILHGSGIFYRGATHIFTALTLGGPEAAQLLDTMEDRSIKKRFMHHYNFPPFSVGETGRVGGFNRRMIGHGALAEKALAPVIPSKEEFPYTIRLVSETMSSNGSSSMGSVCASSLALQDGGVPIKRAVAGIASGLVLSEHFDRDGRYALLTDIQGPEDEHGDMDLKVAGTEKGVTAIQMDVKVAGIPIPILCEALQDAKAARLQILAMMKKEIPAPRPDISPRAPKIITMRVDPSQIGLVIGGGGKTINGIKDETGVEEIAIEDDGTIFITGKNGTAEKARERIAALTRRFEVGERLDVTVVRLTEFGAFARIDDMNEGLIHISEIVPWRLNKVEEVLKVGDVVPTMVIKTDNGKIGLSIKQADPEFAEKRGVRRQK